MKLSFSHDSLAGWDGAASYARRKMLLGGKDWRQFVACFCLWLATLVISLVGGKGGKITMNEFRSFPSGEIVVLIRGAPLGCGGWGLREISLSCSGT